MRFIEVWTKPQMLWTPVDAIVFGVQVMAAGLLLLSLIDSRWWRRRK